MNAVAPREGPRRASYVFRKSLAQQGRAVPPPNLRPGCRSERDDTSVHFIMEPGWLVLLISLFVQMFFTVLASRRGCD